MRNSLAGGLVFAVAVASAAYGGEITWDGTNVQSGNWNDGTSWIGGVAGVSTDLPSADFEAINAAIAEKIECIPSGFVKVTKVDMQHSRIEVKVKKQGLMLLLR